MVFLRAALCGGVVLLLSVALHGEPAAEPLAAPKKVVLCDLERREEASFIRLAISPDQTTFAAVTDRNALRLWDVASGQELSSVRIEIDGELPRCGSLVFAPDGRHIAATFEGHYASQPRFSVCLWDISSTKQLTTVYTLLTQKWGDWTPCIGQPVAFSPDGRMIVAGSPNRTVYLWETATKQERLRFQGGVAAAFTPDNRTLLTVDSDGIVTRRDPATGKPLDAEEPKHNVYHFVRLAAFAPDGSKVAVADSDTILIKDTTSGACLGRFEPSGSMQAIAFSPDGAVLVVSGVTGAWFLDGKTCKFRSWLPNDSFQFVGFRSANELVGEDRNTVVLRDLALVLANPARPPEREGADSKSSGLEVELIANKDTYELDLGGKSADQFSKLLLGESRERPSPPKVDLTLKVRNTSKTDLNVYPPEGILQFSLIGDGAIHVPGEVGWIPLKAKTLAPGKSWERRITVLNDSSGEIYWMAPGEYTLHARYPVMISPAPPGVQADTKGFGSVTIPTAPIKLTVREPKK